MKNCALRLIVCSSIFVTGFAAASPIEITDVAGKWIDAKPGVQAISGLDTETIKWGNLNSGRQSGYSFEGDATSVNSVEEGEQFSLGRFLHFNYPISGASLTAASLKVTTNLMVNGASHMLESIFQFEHWETGNGPAPGKTCANGESRDSVINYYGCADRVTFVLNRSTTSSYSVGPKEYYLDITGFFHNGELAHEVWTQEKNTSTSLLSGIIRSRTLEVPEPTSLVLIALGLLGFCSRKAWRRA